MVEQTLSMLKASAWTVGTFLAFALAFLIFQYIRIAEPECARPAVVVRQVWFNIRIAFVSNFMVAALSPLTDMLVNMIRRKLGEGWIDLHLSNPQTITEHAVAIIAWIVLVDFFFYWFHRMQHSLWFLWPTHRMHHSDEAINPTTASRIHWMEFVVMRFIVFVPVLVLFGPIVVSSWPGYLFVTSVGYWSHSNVRISFGPWFVSPTYHRIHHSCLAEHQGKNLAIYLPLWDVLFGTYHRPREGEYPPTGLYGGERESGVLGANLIVFKLWYDGIRARLPNLRDKVLQFRHRPNG